MSRQVELSPRLRMVGDLIPTGARLADVGTDHAYLPAALILEGKIPSAIAADLRQGPLSRARATARTYGLTGQISFRLCDGLSGIQPEEVDAVSIAGMGGETIAAILEAAPWTCKRDIPLTLQPMSSMPDLRRWLGENSYQIMEERLAREGDTLYTALSVRAGKMAPLTPAEQWVGRNTPQPLRGVWLDFWQNKVERALQGLSKAKQAGGEARVEELRQVQDGLIKMKKEWDSWQLEGKFTNI